MERSKGEEAFNALGLNPQLLLNGILSMVDDAFNNAFNFYHQEALKLVGSGSDRITNSDDLDKGISFIRNLMVGVLDQRMSHWEKYCLDRCFSVPEGFLLPKSKDSSGNCSMHSELSDEQLDLQLDNLRMMLVATEKKNAELQSKVHILEKQAKYDTTATETMQLLEQNFIPQIFKEIKESASKLEEKFEGAMRNMKDDAGGKLVNINVLKDGILKQEDYLSTKLKEIQDVVNVVRRM